ncbi:TetR/AcrR family transcriptional regulator [Azospirillum thermophilum]|uniref:TetR family transcriptional regulator n=1 Tax=Azospirillum thermophilum TaxID=2202148 RepID=A0A2S2CW15_9PROT|nr:TetR/AcrR family transcriptional regulator [Azospirillum thermophilum]AWK88666.1 TetR family transcriptional regulator [Azospirillum thermophilum]
MTTAAHTIDARRHILETGQRIIGGKGFSAVGLNEILAAAGVPKGSFYHYFSSKDAFGEALLETYFRNYLAALDTLLSKPGLTGAERLMGYWEHWLSTQASCDPQGKCLAVKLGAEVSDLSEAMRAVLERGTAQLVRRVARAIEEGVADGSLSIEGDAMTLAQTLYQLWLGASLLGKITRDIQPLETALAATRRLLNLDRAG